MSCQKVDHTIKYHNPEVYVFLSHMYETDTTVDRRMRPIHLFNHNIWLGGDIYSNGKRDQKKFSYLDYLFNLKSPNTHWTIGNHDFTESFEAIKRHTHKPDYYATYIDGITLIVMNSNIYDRRESCELKNEQTDYILSVLDTVCVTSHVILMSHHVAWGNINDDTTNVFAYANTNNSKRYLYCNPDLQVD